MSVRPIEKIKIFPDTDVLIPSLISKSGAAHFIVNELKVSKLTTQYSVDEMKAVVKRLKLSKKNTENIFAKGFETTKLSDSLSALAKSYEGYLLDKYDSHILAGAVVGKADFLLTYNLKHFKSDVIRKDFKLIVMCPGDFMQFIRSNYEV